MRKADKIKQDRMKDRWAKVRPCEGCGKRAIGNRNFLTIPGKLTYLCRKCRKELQVLKDNDKED